jgi:hypothetical protein
MKSRSTAVLPLHFILSLLVVITSFQGLALALKWMSIDSTLHLVLALFSLFGSIVICVVSLSCSEKDMNQLKNEFMSRTDLSWLKSLHDTRQRCLRISFSVLGLLMLGAITGTMAHSGEWPFLHSLLALATIVTVILQSIHWITFQKLFTKTAKDLA